MRRTLIRLSTSAPDASHAALRGLLLASDLEGYLCASLLPSAARGSALAVRALNAELAGVRGAARGNAATARLRLGFWRALVDGAFGFGGGTSAAAAAVAADGAPQRHPLFAPLRDAVARHGHTRRWFERLVDAREADLDADSHAGAEADAAVAAASAAATTAEEAARFAEHTHGSVLFLALEAVGVRDARADEAAAHLARALGVCATLRALPALVRTGRAHARLPAALLARHGLCAADLTASPDEVVVPLAGGGSATLLHEAERNSLAARTAAAASGGGGGGGGGGGIGGSGRGLAMTLAHSGAGFGAALDLQQQQQQHGERGEAAKAPAAPAALPKRASNEGAGGVRRAMSPAAVRLAAAQKAAAAAAAAGAAPTAASVLSFSRPAPPAPAPAPKRAGEGSAAWAAAAASLQSSVGASAMSLAKPPAVAARIRGAVLELADEARGHLERARALRGAMPGAARAALLPAVPADRFLRRLTGAQDGDVFAGGGLGPWQDGRSYARPLLQAALIAHTLANTY